MAPHYRGRRVRTGLWHAAIVFSAVLCFLVARPAGAADSLTKRRPLEMTVLESIDLGAILVMNKRPIAVELAATGHRTSRSGQAAFGSLPYGSGRLRLVGEPGACIRLTAHSAGRGGDSAGRIEVERVLLRSSNAAGQEEIRLRLDSNGPAIVEVGVALRLSAIEQSKRWRLSLSFEARYGEDCLD